LKSVERISERVRLRQPGSIPPARGRRRASRLGNPVTIPHARNNKDSRSG